MSDNRIDMVDAAKGLARNPLGIIALFIVFVYACASFVLSASFIGSLTRDERLPLIYFVVLFPVIVLAVFAWLVSRHSGKLFAPTDFKDEENYVKMQLSAVASLATAAAKNPSMDGAPNIEEIIEAVRESTPQKSVSMNGWKNHILWVDDIPENNFYARQAFEAVGIKFSLALSTNEALAAMKMQKFAAVISDMGRKEGPREGYVLLDTMRANGNNTPLFFYAGSNEPKHKQETYDHGGQGCTNNGQELFQMVMKAVVSNSN